MPTPPSSDPFRSRPPAPSQGRPVPPPPSFTDRPAPPRPNDRPAPPSVQTEFVGSDLMAYLTKTVDRNDNNLVEDDEARFSGQVGNGNGSNGTSEAARSMNDGRAAMYGFQLTQRAADAVAAKLAGNDPWISRADLDITDAARDRMDSNRDNRIDRQELADGLRRGGLGINAKGIMTTDEAKSRFPSRPTPPSVSPRPAPPRPDFDRPTPPPVFNHRAPGDVLRQFQQAHADLKRVYDTTSMTQATFNEADGRLIKQAIDSLVNDTTNSPFAERKACLKAMYDGSSMNQTQHNEVEQRLLRTAIDQLLNGFGTFAEKGPKLKALYDGSAMNQTQKTEVEQQLIAKEIEFILYGPQPSFDARRNALERLYSGSSMNQTQRDEVRRKIEQMEIDRITGR